MKKKTRPQPTRARLSIFRQVCIVIPTHLAANLARQFGVDAQARHPLQAGHISNISTEDDVESANHHRVEGEEKR